MAVVDTAQVVDRLWWEKIAAELSAQPGMDVRLLDRGL